jgi:trehalose 6-phosphate synthase
MPLAERKRRWQSMFENVRDEDVIWWRHAFVDALKG